MSFIDKLLSGRKVYHFLFAVLLFIFSVLVACKDEETQRLADGEQIYISTCSHCHQPNGEGFDHIYPNLAGNPIVTLFDPNPTIDIVLDGREAMPPYRSELTVDELAKVVSYVRHAWGNNASPVTASQMK